MATERDPIDEDVERAFDLLQHYEGLLTSSHQGPEDLRDALSQLEDVMRAWLPRAARANDPLVAAVSAKLGERDVARELLARADLREARIQCLQRLADSSIPPTLGNRDLLVECRARLQHWRKLLPPVSRRSDGQRLLHPGHHEAANLIGSYWSTDINERPSRRGASLFLAAGCDALARAAHRAGRAFQAPVLLAQRLRERPNWADVEPFEVLAVLDEQLTAARGVEDLIAEFNIVASAESPALVTPQEPGRVGASRRRKMTCQTALAHSRNSLSQEQLAVLEAAFERLARDFDTASEAIRSATSSCVVFADVRTLMATAGRLLLRLLLHRVIDGPGSMPSWLGLGYSRPRPRPLFREIREAPVWSSWSPPRHLAGLVSNVDSTRLARDEKTPRSSSESRIPIFLHRHVWLEACSSWLGSRCEPRIRITAPTVVAVSKGDQEEDVRLVVDWDDDQTNPTLLFLEITRGSDAACRHLAGILRKLVARSGSEDQVAKSRSAVSEVLGADGDDRPPTETAPGARAGRTVSGFPPENLGAQKPAEVPELPDWHDLSPKQQAVVAWMLNQTRGEAFTRNQILDSAYGIHNKGEDRRILDELIDLGIARVTDGKRPQLRLARLPARTPSTVERHASWSDS